MKCKICGVTDQEAEFYKGVTSRCKECHKKKVRENRAANVDYYRAYDAKRFQEDPKVKARHLRYQSTDAGKQSMHKARKKWEDNNKDKRSAHYLLSNSVRDGKVFKPENCSLCGCKPSRLHGHHEDYTKPLDVVWCCSKCHEEIHKGKHSWSVFFKGDEE